MRMTDFMMFSSCRVANLPWQAWLLVALLGLSGCGESRGTVGPLSEDAVVLAFGDSLTYGTGAGAGEDYPSQLAVLTGHRVVNAGVPGETTDRGLRRLAAVMDQYQPELVILCHGGNDILQNRNEAEIEANLRHMIELIQARGARVLLLGVPRKSVFFDTAPLYQRIADDTRVAFLDGLLTEVLRDASLKFDAVHPNARGYRRFAEEIARATRG
jgi:acyl-CoA thioesterase I